MPLNLFIIIIQGLIMTKEYDNTWVWSYSYDCKKYLDYNNEFTISEVVEIMNEIKKDAEELGFVGVKFSFESTREPYEDYLGSPRIVAWGWRKKTEEEIKAEETEDFINHLSQKLSIQPYQARVYLEIKDKILNKESQV